MMGSHGSPQATFASHSKKIQKVVRPTRSVRQQGPLCRTKNGNLSIVYSLQGTGAGPVYVIRP